MEKRSCFLTCNFKLHNPSRQKREVIDYALREYTAAWGQLIAWAQENECYLLDRVGPSANCTRALQSLLPRPSEKRLHSSLYDSLLHDVAGTLAAYFELRRINPGTGFPSTPDPASEADTMALEHFRGVGSDLTDYEESRARYMRQAHRRYIPLYFCRSEAHRNFTLLFNAQKRQLLAVLYLLPRGHPLGRPLETRDNLFSLNTGEVFRSASSAAILVPLEVGRNQWQWLKFLEPNYRGQVQTKSAFLTKRGDDYFLHVSFEFPRPDCYEPHTYLGIDRGILITTAYALIDGCGAVLEAGLLDENLRQFQIENGKLRQVKARRGKAVTKRDYKQREVEARLHRLANRLLQHALNAKAAIVLEKLDAQFQVRGSLFVSRFRKLQHIIEYKAALLGIPVREVFAAYSSVICPACGETMQRSADRQEVRCNWCGYTGHADSSAAINIARRALYRKADWQSYREFHRAVASRCISDT